MRDFRNCQHEYHQDEKQVDRLYKLILIEDER